MKKSNTKAPKAQRSDRDHLGLTATGRAALDRMVDRIKTGDLSQLKTVVAVRLQRVDNGVPAEKWSFLNQLVVMLQTGDFDNRTKLQWEAAGYNLRKGCKAGFVQRPNIIFAKDGAGNFIEDGDGNRKVKAMRFDWFPVFSSQDVEAFRDDAEALPLAVDFTPDVLPPLYDVAAAFGVEVVYMPMAGRLGFASYSDKRIGLGTHDAAVFFHELAHQAHRSFEAKTGNGQESEAETIAELTAGVLMALYCNEDRLGNVWQYISGYNEDPVAAVLAAMDKVVKVLDLIFEQAAKLGEFPILAAAD